MSAYQNDHNDWFLLLPSMLKRLLGENQHSSNAVEDVKLACATAGLTQ